MSGDPGFRSAEAWLAERGIAPEPVTTEAPATDPDREPPPDGSGPAVAGRLTGAESAAGDVPVETGTQARRSGSLEDDVAQAVAFVRRSAGATPQAEGRLRAKLAERGYGPQVVDLALQRARRERLVDDPALAAALADERARRGHAPARIGRDLLARGFDADVVDAVLAPLRAQDPHAAAFAVAVEKASRLTGVPAETAYRRVAAYVHRRGHGEALARTVAREAVFATREDEAAATR